MVTEEIPLVSNTSRYQIPSRSIGNRLREVQFKTNSNTLIEMTRIYIEDRPYFQYNSLNANSVYANAFYTEGNEIVLVPNLSTSAAGGSLLMTYYMRPSRLVLVEQGAFITGINTLTNTITLDQYPKTFENTSTMDITSSASPFRILARDITPATYGDIYNPQLVLSSLPTHLAVGDMITLSEESIIPQVPSELHSMLAQRTAMRCLESLGDSQGLNNAMVKLQEMEKKTYNLIDNRVEGAPLKVSPKNTFLRRSRQIFRR
jgi:hypothetical protein